MRMSELNEYLMFMKYSIQDSIQEFQNGIEEFSYFSNRTSNSNITEKFDTAASSCMSGIKDRRMEGSKDSANDVSIVGFNNSRSSASEVGRNIDGKREYFVPNIQKKKFSIALCTCLCIG
jgi:hypothetical protein